MFSGFATCTPIPWIPWMACSAGTPPPVQPTRGSPSTPTSAYSMPHGWRSRILRVPSTSASVTSTCRSVRRALQKSSDPAGTASSTSRAWLVPRLPIRPACRNGNVVTTAPGSPAALL